MKPREFAIATAAKLQQAGFEALWAGGCVRDQLLGRQPTDYDIATSATPQQIRALFGHRKTIAIGESFGVITVIGSKASGNIEVATFRKDAGYSDGRRPDSVEFTDAKEDALRRDFTINGMFFDPIADKLIDFVDGRADIDCRVVRAIGDPAERINEDRLRMLRAVRFAATFDFELDSGTAAAIRDQASEIHAVSAERIGAEMRRMLAHPNRARAMELLQSCQLLPQIVPSGDKLFANRANWKTRLRWLGELGGEGTFEQAAAIALSRILKLHRVAPITAAWKLSNAEAEQIGWIEANLLTLSRAHKLPWSTLQPLLIHRYAIRALQVAAIQFGPDHPGVQFCQDRLSQPPSELNPAALIDGRDLKQAGISMGPIFSQILSTVRQMQLDGEITSKQQAMKVARSLANSD